MQVCHVKQYEAGRKQTHHGTHAEVKRAQDRASGAWSPETWSALAEYSVKAGSSHRAAGLRMGPTDLPLNGAPCNLQLPHRKQVSAEFRKLEGHEMQLCSCLRCVLNRQRFFAARTICEIEDL